MKNNKKIILCSIIGILIGTLLSISYAMFTLSIGGNYTSKLVAGEIYMKYKETSNSINITDMMPMSGDPLPNQYFEFTVEGKNKTTDKDIIYDISIVHGDDYDDGDNDDTNDKVRIRDEFLRFTLKEKIDNGEWVTVLNNKQYLNFSSGTRIYVDKILKNTTSDTVHTYRLYVWVDSSIVIGSTNQDYTSSEWNNLFASVKVNVTGDFSEKRYIPLYTKIRESLTNDNSVTDEDNVTYISGCSDEAVTDADCTNANKINFNFVWYSGKLWRIIAIYPNGEMKLVTENPITSIYWGNMYETYGSSWLRQWLNEDFRDTLVNKNNALIFNNNDFYWNAKLKSYNDVSKQPKETETSFTDAVGMLDLYEYIESYKKTGDKFQKGYLSVNQYWWLLSPYTNSFDYSSHMVYTDGSWGGQSPNSMPFAIRPSIYLKSTVTFAGGSGTRNNPYFIGEDIGAPTANAKLNTRVSEEYVTFKNELFRIVDIDSPNNTTKIVKANFVTDGNGIVLKKKFASTAYFGKTDNEKNDDYWDYYLNNSWLTSNDLDFLEIGIYYLGKYSKGHSYKETLCDTTNDNSDYHLTTKACNKLTNTENVINVFTGYVGLLRVGEMFSSQVARTSNSIYMWSITPNSDSKVCYFGYGGYIQDTVPNYNNVVVRPTVNLKSNVIITNASTGDGTEQHPWAIALGS